MREIKFRAWAEKTVNNRWEYAYQNAEAEIEELKRSGEEYDEYELRHKYATEWMKTHSEDEIYTKTKEMITDIKVNGDVQRPYGYEVIAVMQFTGLHDKNGKEIWEGDVVKRNDGQIFVVEGTVGAFVFRNKNNGNDDGFISEKWETYYATEMVENELQLEVIGNIHENPELLTNH